MARRFIVPVHQMNEGVLPIAAREWERLCARLPRPHAMNLRVLLKFLPVAYLPSERQTSGLP